MRTDECKLSIRIQLHVFLFNQGYFCLHGPVHGIIKKQAIEIVNVILNLYKCETIVKMWKINFAVTFLKVHHVHS